MLAITQPMDSSVPGARALVIAVIATLVLTASVLAGVLVLLNRADWWRGLVGAGVISALAAAASLPPLVWGLKRPQSQKLAAYFVSAGQRAAISLGGSLAAVMIGRYPAAATMLLMVVFYMALLAVESIFLARSMWHSPPEASRN